LEPEEINDLGDTMCKKSETTEPFNDNSLANFEEQVFPLFLSSNDKPLEMRDVGQSTDGNKIRSQVQNVGTSKLDVPGQKLLKKLKDKNYKR